MQEILTLQLFIMMRQQKWMDPVSTVVDLDPSHLFRGNFGFSRGFENNVWLNGGNMEAKYHIAIYLGIGVTIQQKALNKYEQEDEEAIFR